MEKSKTLICQVKCQCSNLKSQHFTFCYVINKQNVYSLTNTLFESKRITFCIMSDDINLSLDNLSTELLLVVFSYFPVSDLINLKKTCRRFHNIIHHYWDIILFNRRVQFLVTNQCSELIQKRSRKILGLPEKHRISNNWQEGRYAASHYNLSRNCIPYFHLEKNSIWLGSKYPISCYYRDGHKIELRRSKHKIPGSKSSPMCKFIVNNNNLSVANGKRLQQFSLANGYPESISILMKTEANCLDMDANLIAVGTKEGLVQLFKIPLEPPPVTKTMFKDVIWSLSLNGDKLALGTAANNSKTAIAFVDTQRGEVLQELLTDEKGAGVLNMKWDNPNMIWSGGYDMHLRRWDLRIGECVQKYLDPWGSKVNCFDYDFANTMITGCDDLRTVLWDTRMTKYVQMYFVKSEFMRSPVYHLAFDAECLFAITNSHLTVLNFSEKRGMLRDYSKLFMKQLVI